MSSQMLNCRMVTILLAELPPVGSQERSQIIRLVKTRHINVGSRSSQENIACWACHTILDKIENPQSAPAPAES